MAAKTERQKLLAAIHIAKKDLALTEESYRDLLERVTEHRTCKACSIPQLEKVLDEFGKLGWTNKPRKRGSRGGRPKPQLAKLKALWMALYWLAEVDNASDEALAAFVKRQVGVEALAWLKPDDANTCIEALKDWCGRAGFKVPETSKDGGLEARRDLLLALWSTLHEAGAVRIDDEGALRNWLIKRKVMRPSLGVYHLSHGQLDESAALLGHWLRKVKGKDQKGDGQEHSD